jgi:manganese/zinc/iron transport system substrate-binding protein
MFSRILILAVVLLAAACGERPEGGESPTFQGQHPIKVVATTGIVADLARNIGGALLEVSELMGPGIDPHLYQASPGDISLINRADLVLYNGLHLEGKMGEIFERVGRRKPVHAVTDGIPQERLLDDEGAADPHLWFDVALWADTIAPLTEFLAHFDPANADRYRDNAERYRQELLALDREVRESLATLPADRRVLVTAHDAFGYFGRAYDVEVHAIQGISTESEAGLHEINALVDLLVKRRIPAVFIETSVSEKNIRALLEGASRRGAKVRIGGELYSDALGPKGTGAETYSGMVRHNVRQIVEALGG